MNLWRNRVPVLTDEQWIASPSTSILYVEVLALPDPRGIQYGLTLAYGERIRLVRDRAVEVPWAPLWDGREIGYGPRDYFLGRLEEYCDSFCNGFLASRCGRSWSTGAYQSIKTVRPRGSVPGAFRRHQPGQPKKAILFSLC